jgi:hypothetical protein
MKIIERTLCQVEGDYNLNNIYNKFNELTNLDLEFEIGQEHGTDCYDVITFTNSLYEGDYPTLEELEEKIQKFKDKTLDEYDDINVYDIVNYLRRKGILPEQDLLFEVSY